MGWNFCTDQPIYAQLVARVAESIVSGKYAPGERLPSVRDFAMDAGVNPNTMQRALTDLEREGLVSSHRTSGRFVTEDASVIQTCKSRMVRQRIEQFFLDMQRIGCSEEEAETYLKGEWKTL